MLTDSYGTRHASDSREAVAAFAAAVRGVAAHQPVTGTALGAALAADPHLVAAHALEGFGHLLLARAELAPAATAALARARAALQARDSTPCERALVEALSRAVDGRPVGAADRLEAHLDAHPGEFLPAKLAHALRFMAGDAPGMLRLTSRAVTACPAAAPGYGFLLGCHAFALEESGQIAAAERAGRRAVELEPEDAWGLHAVSHVHETERRTAEGVAWLEAHRAAWSRCNNFALHIAWHLALLHLERGDHERVLALYDREVRPAPTDDFRDVANAVSLLWRLNQEGVAVGRRWDELRAVALRRRGDATLAFATLHHLLALVATGETGPARELLAAMEAKARGAGDQAMVMRAVGCQLGRLILSLATGAGVAAPLDHLARELHRLGGSHTQRDVFLRTLAAVAAARGDRGTLDAVLAVRRRVKRDDGFVDRLLQQHHA